MKWNVTHSHTNQTNGWRHTPRNGEGNVTDPPSPSTRKSGFNWVVRARRRSVTVLQPCRLSTCETIWGQLIKGRLDNMRQRGVGIMCRWVGVIIALPVLHFHVSNTVKQGMIWCEIIKIKRNEMIIVGYIFSYTPVRGSRTRPRRTGTP